MCSNVVVLLIGVFPHVGDLILFISVGEVFFFFFFSPFGKKNKKKQLITKKTLIIIMIMTLRTLFLVALIGCGYCSGLDYSNWEPKETQDWLSQKGLNYNNTDGWMDITGSDLVSNIAVEKLNITNPLHVAKLEAYSQMLRGTCPCNTQIGVRSLLDVVWYSPSPSSVYFFLANTRMFLLYTFFTTYMPTWSDSGHTADTFSTTYKPANYSSNIARDQPIEGESYGWMLYFTLSLLFPYLTAIWHFSVFMKVNPFIFFTYVISILIETADEAIHFYDFISTTASATIPELKENLKVILQNNVIHWGIDTLIILVLYFIEGYLPFVVQSLFVVAILGLHTWGVILLL